MTLSTSTYNRRLENGQIIEPTDLDDPANPIPKYGWSTYTSANGTAESGGPAGAARSCAFSIAAFAASARA